MSEERKYKKVKTSELLDFVCEDISYTNDKEYDKKREYENELEHREPFDHIKSKLEHLQRDFNHLRRQIDHLKKHKHRGEKVVVDVDEIDYRR